MTRTATGATLTLLDALEPEAKAGWEAELLNITEAIAASQAITDRRGATIAVRSLDTTTQESLPNSIRTAYDPDFVEP